MRRRAEDSAEIETSSKAQSPALDVDMEGGGVFVSAPPPPRGDDKGVADELFWRTVRCIDISDLLCCSCDNIVKEPVVLVCGHLICQTWVTPEGRPDVSCSPHQLYKYPGADNSELFHHLNFFCVFFFL